MEAAQVPEFSFDFIDAARILALLFVANGAPIILDKVLGSRLGLPVDGGLIMPDGRPVFGPSKTLRGVAGALVFSAAVAPTLGFSARTGLLAGIGAMLGDLFSSFIKRRLGIRSSGMALGLDQIPESLIPLLLLRRDWELGVTAVLVLVLAFVVLELALSQLLFRLHIRREPY
jgi:hypothetical protein